LFGECNFNVIDDVYLSKVDVSLGGDGNLIVPKSVSAPPPGTPFKFGYCPDPINNQFGTLTLHTKLLQKTPGRREQLKEKSSLSSKREAHSKSLTGY